jgi:NADPH-dependent 2,4-dienoyl-CoA reductase/sulfur reductase-like enzyme
MPDEVTLSVDGVSIRMPGGSMVSAAVLKSGITSFHRSVTNEARGPLCGMGICFECRVTIDGEDHRRSCLTVCQSGMDVRTEKDSSNTGPLRTIRVKSRQESDVVVVGAGPAGLAAAYRAAKGGLRVTVVDENPNTGGQIWRGEEQKPTSKEATAWFEKINSVDIEFLAGASVFQQSEGRKLLAETPGGLCELSYSDLILATGARERFLPFPGWTLPNVMGAGGLQALVKTGLPIEGKKLVIAGSGPLLLAVSSYLRGRGADVLLIAEQASPARLARFGVSLLKQSGKAAQALALKRRLKGVQYLMGCWPIAAHGDEKLTSVSLQQGTRTRQVLCDYLACGFHLVPNLELAQLLGCKTENGCVQVGEFQETSVSNIFSVGESTGIGGLELSLVEGEIAGLAVSGNRNEARKLFTTREKHQRFARILNRTFDLCDELKTLVAPNTILCRCEDVTFDRLSPFDSWRAAKLQTRCGMGPCQGRICGGAVEFLLGWQTESVRPPVFPVRLESLMMR